MTIIVAGVVSVIALLFASGVTMVAGAASDRARAQAAADSAALAAVSESGPYGGGDPEALALDYAARNGASLEVCFCVPGASAMQVRVRYEGIGATARAVIDPTLLFPSAPSVADGLHPSVEDAVEELLLAGGGRITLVSGHRTTAEQEVLWARAVARYGDPEIADDWVARPGDSMHERGLAVDLGGDLDLAVRLIDQRELPLHRPLSNEPWHFELLGSRGGSFG